MGDPGCFDYNDHAEIAEQRKLRRASQKESGEVSESNVENLIKLRESERKASAALRVALEHQFPKGTMVAFMIRYSQKNPSYGEVIGYDDHGYLRIKHRYLRIKHHQAKEFSRFAVRRVSFDSVQVLTKRI